jgi:TolA-binding protein
MKMKYNVSLFFFFPILLLVGCNANEDSIRFQVAEDLWEKGFYSEAAVKYDSIVNDYPHSRLSPPALYKKGVIESVYLLDYDSALNTFKKLIVLFPESEEIPQAKRQIADIYMSHLKDYEKAILAYEQLIAEEAIDNIETILFTIALAYIKTGDLEQGRIELHNLISRYPSSSLIPRAYFEIANSYMVEGEEEQAINNYRKIIEFYPSSTFYIDSQFGTAVALEEQGKLTEALTLYEELEGEHPNPSAVRVRISSLENRLKGVKKRK